MEAGGALWDHHPGFWTLIDLEMSSHCPLLGCGARVCHVTFISLSFPICKLGMIITLRHKVDARISEAIGIEHLRVFRRKPALSFNPDHHREPIADMQH